MTDSSPSGPPLHVERRGEGEALALVHGFTQTGASWAALTEQLSGDHSVILPDLPGHGDSPLAEGDLGVAAARLGAACGPAAYVGYSLGGRVCLHLALAQPGLVGKLVLVSTTAGIEDADARQERQVADDALADRIEEAGDAGIGEFIEEWLSGPLFAEMSAEAANREARLHNRAAGLASSLRNHGVGRQLPLWERLGELEMPVLVVAGAKDDRFVDAGQRLAAAIGPNALFVLVPDAGHGVAFEQPEAFSRLLADFLAERTGQEE